MLSAFSQRLEGRLAITTAVFCVTAAFAASVILQLEAFRLEAARAQVMAQTSSHAQMFQRNIERALSATYAMSALVRQGKGVISDFDSVADQMLPYYPGVAALGLAPKGVVKNIVPIAGNERSIGHDMLNDPLRGKDAIRARDSGQLTLAGPYTLVQGGLGAVARLPVFLGDNGDARNFWGFTTVLLRFPEALSPAQLAELSNQGLAYELWRIESDTGKKQVIAASSTSPLVAPMTHSLKVANSDWTLGVAPEAGWGDPLGLSLKAALGLVFSLMLSYMTRLLLEQKAHKRELQSQVAQRTAEIQASRLQLQTTIDAIPDQMWELGLDGHIHDCHFPRSDSSAAHAGTLIGKTISNCFPPDAAALIMSALREADDAGRSVGNELSLQSSSGRVWFELSICRKNADLLAAPRFIVLARDVTERKAAEGKVQRLTRLYAALSECNQAIVRCTSEEELFSRICRDAVQFGGMKTAWVGMVDKSNQRVVPVASYGDEMHFLDGLEVSCAADSPFGQGAVGTALRTNQPVWFQDYQNDPRTSPWRERAIHSGWAGVAALPLRRSGAVIGVFCLYAGEVNAFDQAACSLLVEMALDISFALDNFEREAARRESEAALRESKARYRAVTQFANDAIITADRLGNVASWNQGAQLIFGYAEAEVIGQPLTMLMPERYRERHLAGMHRFLSSGQPRVIGHTFEAAGVRKDGTEFPLELSLAKWEIAEGEFFTGVIRDISKRKETEATLQLAAKVFEQSNEGITITDADCNIVLINHAFTVITGYSESEAIGKNPRLLSSGCQGPQFYSDMWDALNAHGHWQGEIWNRRKDGSAYPEWLSISLVRDASGKVCNYIGIFSDITQRKAAEERILKLGHFDPLTGLANRILLNDRINQAIITAKRNGTNLAVLFFDLDHFKHVNDSLGHSVGDRLLVEVAARLKNAVREQDTVGRPGGDEFVLVLPDTGPEGAAHLAEKLLETVAESYWIDQHELVVTPSIGIAVYPGDGADCESLLKCADVAMYRAKKEGRYQHRLYTAEMQAQSVRTLQLANALRSALKRNQLMLHYQPQVSLTDGRVIGAEALLRWSHPELGMISPVEFIPIAEDDGQILAIGEWVMRTAARQCMQWIERGLHGMTMAINLSAVQLRQLHFPELVMQVLNEVKLPPQCLELELTESVAMGQPVEAAAMLDRLHRLGVGMSIDDFGTGYSSLSYLKRFHVNKLKIDRSFIRDVDSDPDDRAIVGAIIGLARNMGMQTIAEGVETEEQVGFLQSLQCDEVQGFYFSRPLPAEQFEAFARERMVLQ
ncbi:EAL domain-containing protein [Noviherbaspirillum denitrificans]|uniref:Diguanylate cyclase n=1 Tax=Noviherbaspirillum denitrificans TaxID=1968433 RepID=A0A254T7E0_9BURK|nr:EAL domain-containing protein [Noviherbaspirillum denitrificans]OWW18097.1 hypothetical protein AYR66_01870 [Noviherbaspirillum denitrificans]